MSGPPARDPSAMHTSGITTTVGGGPAQSSPCAFLVPRGVAQHRYESAANNIASIYRDRKDYRRAFVWYRKAADAGDGDALVEVAVRYLRGRGVRKDSERGVKLLRRAIRSNRITESGRDDAKYYLGLCYLRGSGVPMSVARARKWLPRPTVRRSSAQSAIDSLRQASWRIVLRRSNVSGCELPAAYPITRTLMT